MKKRNLFYIGLICIIIVFCVYAQPSVDEGQIVYVSLGHLVDDQSIADLLGDETQEVAFYDSVRDAQNRKLSYIKGRKHQTGEYGQLYPECRRGSEVGENINYIYCEASITEEIEEIVATNGTILAKGETKWYAAEIIIENSYINFHVGEHNLFQTRIVS